MDQIEEKQYGSINFSQLIIQPYQSPVNQNNRINSTWKHILPQELTINIQNIKTKESQSLKFDPYNINININLPYGDYTYTIIEQGNEYEKFLPIYTTGEFRLNSAELSLPLEVKTDYGLVTVLNKNIIDNPTLTDDTKYNMVLVDDYYYLYVKKGKKPTLEVIENIFESSIKRSLEIEAYKHYNFLVKTYTGINKVSELLLKEFQYIEEELNVNNPDYIYLESFSSNTNEAWRLAIQQEGKILRLLDNKVYHLTEFETSEPKIKAIVGKNSTIIFGKDNFNQFTDTGEAGVIFRFTKDNPIFGIVGVNLLQAEKTIIGTMTHSKVLFSSAPGNLKTGKLAWINSHPPNKDWLTVKLAGFLYSGTNGDNNDFIYVIGKNLTITGPDVSQFKANGGGGLFNILQNVEMYNPLIGFGNITYFNPTSFLTEGYIQNDIYHITNNITTYSIRTIYNYQGDFRRCIIHIGRFVFNISNESVLDSKRIKLDITKKGDKNTFIKVNNRTLISDIELHPGDITNLGKIIEKQIEFYGGKNWKYIVDKDINFLDYIELLEPSFNLSGNHQSYLVYKGNEDFWGDRLTENTKFGYDGIIRGAGYGWTMYNHKEITLHWENVKFSGFYRQSASNKGNSQGYTLINVTGTFGQFNPPVPVKTSGQIPQDAQDFINWLESLK